MALALGVAWSAGSCGRRKTDEELLREKIDCTAVHLYVASKVALTRDGQDPEVQRARALLNAAIDDGARVMHGLNARRGAPGAPSSGAVSQDGGGPMADPSPPLALADVGRLALALWNLRAEGARIVRSADGRGEDALRPVLPAILGSISPGWAASMDVQTEHAVLFLVLLVLKFDERVPVPIPPEVVLYEASRTDPGRVRLEGLQTVLHGGRAWVFASNELCDLAQRDATALDRLASNPTGLRRTLETLSNGRSAPPRAVESVDPVFQALAHGGTAVCFARRGQDGPMKDELRRFIDALHGLGISREDTGVFRAFLAHENNDVPGARAALADARRAQHLDADTRARIDAMDGALAGGDRGAARRQFDRGQLGLLVGRVVFRHLERTGAFDGLGESEPLVRVREYLAATSRATEQASRTVGATAQQVERRARGFFNRFRR
jgi:hypothetical protein